MISVAPRRDSSRDLDLERRLEIAERKRQELEDALIAMARRDAPPQPPSRDDRSIFDRFARHVPPTYDGAIDPVILEEWLREMEKLFDATGCPEGDMLAVGTYYLRKEADNWWSIQKQNNAEARGYTWAQFVEKLKERFYPESLRWKKQEEFLELSQKGLSVQGYTDRFVELSKFAPTNCLTEVDRVRRYIQRLNAKIKAHVLGREATTFQKAYEVALTIDAAVQEDEAEKAQAAKRPAGSYFPPAAKRERFNVGFQQRRDWQPRRPFQQGTNFRRNNDVQRCPRCRKGAHPGFGCNGNKIVCFTCGKDGHKSFQCPEKTGASTSGASKFTKPAIPTVPQKNRVYCMTQQEADARPDVMTGTLPRPRIQRSSPEISRLRIIC